MEPQWRSAAGVVVTHAGDSGTIEGLMQALQLGAAVTGREAAGEVAPEVGDQQQRRLLVIVLLINAGLFVLELAVGLVAQSMGLVADSLDMLADAIVYGLSLYAVGRAVIEQKRVARLSGYFQLALAVFGMVEVVRRFLGAGDEPQFALMIAMSLVALAGNVAALLVLQRSRRQEVHIKASWIFTTNDVLVNLGVIVAGALVFITGSRLPDLAVGTLVFGLVGFGAFRILRLSR
jgi:Co/Zn/Cd efflux system component